MTSGLDGTVAPVTGAGRGQDRAHGVRPAQEGALVVPVVRLAADSARALTSVPLPVDARSAAR